MKTIRLGTFALTLLVLVWIGAGRWMETHDDAFTAEGLLESHASDLQRTFVTPQLEYPLAEQQNVLWCGSFQLAWNEACDQVGESMHFRDNEPTMVELLNKRSFTKNHIDDKSYVAVGGFVKDDVFGKIARELKATFKGKATPRYLPPQDLVPRPQDLVTYAYLFKNLEFSVPFERIQEPIDFETARVPCFGMGEKFKDQHLGMLDQLLILDYRSDDDFIVELRTKGKQDKLILAKVPPQETLAEMVKMVRKRAGGAPERPSIGDILKIPKLNFDITRRYRELEGGNLVVSDPQVAPDLVILSAVQNIRFQLDEEGVRLRSESHIAFGCAAAPSPPSPQHIMVFDKPFLIMLQRSGAAVPYFALWVANPEILVKVEGPSSVDVKPVIQRKEGVN